MLRQLPQPEALRISVAAAIKSKVFFISCFVPRVGTLRSRGLPMGNGARQSRMLFREQTGKYFSRQAFTAEWHLANIAWTFCLIFPANRNLLAVCGECAIRWHTIIPSRMIVPTNSGVYDESDLTTYCAHRLEYGS